MGLEIEKDSFRAKDYHDFSERLQQNLKVLKGLLKNADFGLGPETLGVELECSIVDKAFQALPINQTICDEMQDPNLQSELNQFNLEYNFPPTLMSGKSLSQFVLEIRKALARMNQCAQKNNASIVPIGILPTLTQKALTTKVMSDGLRYRVLSRAVQNLRQEEAVIVNINGEEPLQFRCQDLTMEGANTSVQFHLKVCPSQFAAFYNAIQIATPIALAIGVNSPIFLQHKLWDETRIAVFKQVVESRKGEPEIQWRRPARVCFGYGWVCESAYELFAQMVYLHPPLLPILSKHPPETVLEGLQVPDLYELRLHQGSIWQWNRAIYDPSLGGHLRIEMRALPSGPTAVDMMANAAFLIGLAYGLKPHLEKLLPAFPFMYCEYNFYRAAQYGLESKLLWPDFQKAAPQERNAGDLISELLSYAAQGLSDLKVEDREIDYFLGVIKGRVLRYPLI